jgi:hypothetical protein
MGRGDGIKFNRKECDFNEKSSIRGKNRRGWRRWHRMGIIRG